MDAKDKRGHDEVCIIAGLLAAFESDSEKAALMKIPELRKILSDHGVRPRAYSIQGPGLLDEQYRLERDGKLWIIYYFERGNMTGVRKFPNEEEACRYFLETLLNDSGTRRSRFDRRDGGWNP